MSDRGPKPGAQAGDLPASPQIAKGQAGFAGSVLALGSGATVAHVIAFACAPVVSRLFTPEAFGAAAMFAAIVLVIAVLASLRYESALMLPASDAEAANLLVVSCVCVALGSGLVCIAAALTGDWLGSALRAEALAKYKWLFPVGVFTWGIGLPLRSSVARHKRFRSLAAFNVAETATSSAGKIGTGWAGLVGAGPLIVAGVVARAVPVAAITCQLAIGDLKFILTHVSLREMIRLGRRYARFPLIDTWSAALGQFSVQIPFVLLGAYLGAAVAGHYSRAVLLAQIPFLLAGNSIGQVFFQRAAESRAACEPLRALVEPVLERLIWISLLPMALISLIGTELFTVVLGGQWGAAGSYARMLAGWLFLQGIAMPLAGLLRVLGKFGAALLFSVAIVAAQLAALVLGGRGLASPDASVALLAGAGAAVHGALCVFLIIAAGSSLPRAGAYVLRYLAYSLPTLAVAAGGKWLLDLQPWQTVAASALASVSYVVLVLRHDRWALQRALSLLGPLGRALRRNRGA